MIYSCTERLNLAKDNLVAKIPVDLFNQIQFRYIKDIVEAGGEFEGKALVIPGATFKKLPRVDEGHPQPSSSTYKCYSRRLYTCWWSRVNLEASLLADWPQVCIDWSDPRAFSPLLNHYEKFISLSHERGCVVVLLRKASTLQVHPVFLVPEGRLVTLNVSHSSKQWFVVVTFYAPVGGGQVDVFEKIEKFMLTSRTLVVLVAFNTINHAPIDCVGSSDRRGLPWFHTTTGEP